MLSHGAQPSKTLTALAGRAEAPRICGCAPIVGEDADVLRARHTRRPVARGRSPLAAVSGVLGRADLAVVNLETAVGARGAAQPKEYTFSAPPALLAALADAGVDVVNLANNHTLDYGARGLGATVRAARTAGLRVVGAGLTPPARTRRRSCAAVAGRSR